MMNQTYDLDNYQNTFAAWLDGMLSPKEEETFNEMLSSNSDLRELLDANDLVDETYEQMMDEGYELPDEFLMNFDIPHVDGDSDGVLPYDDDSFVDFEDDQDSTEEYGQDDEDSDNDFDSDFDFL